MSDTSRYVFNFQHEVDYKWRVRGCESSGYCSQYSAFNHFETRPSLGPPPATPTLISPLDGSDDEPENVTLVWGSVSRANDYAYHVRSSAGAIRTGTVSGTSTALVLGADSSYIWRVQSCDVLGSCSQWASSWRFTTGTGTVPSVPSLVSPIGGEEITTLVPDLTWGSVWTSGDDIEYELQLTQENEAVQADSGFVCSEPGCVLYSATITDDETGSDQIQAVPAGILAVETEYNWHVRACNVVSSRCSAWSEVGTFLTRSTSITRYYYLQDHLGSVRATVNEVDELDEETDQYYAGARYLDPVIGRWNAVDPLADDFPSMSPYNYVLKTFLTQLIQMGTLFVLHFILAH